MRLTMAGSADLLAIVRQTSSGRGTCAQSSSIIVEYEKEGIQKGCRVQCAEKGGVGQYISWSFVQGAHDTTASPWSRESIRGSKKGEKEENGQSPRQPKGEPDSE